MSNVAALERGLKALDLLIEVEADAVRRTKGVSVQQVANELDVHKSSASRIMQTLVATGYAVPNNGRGFRVGPSVQIHQGLSVEQRELAERAHPFLVRLVEATGEGAHVAVASGPWAFVIDDVETAQQLRVVAGKGRRVPLHCTSAGKALLAWEMATIPDELPARTARTITNPDMLTAHLAEIRKLGYALDDEENDTGVRCISAPVFFGPDGDPVGVIGIDGPSVRMDHDHIPGLAKQTTAIAQDLSVFLGQGRAPVTARTVNA